MTRLESITLRHGVLSRGLCSCGCGKRYCAACGGTDGAPPCRTEACPALRDASIVKYQVSVFVPDLHHTAHGLFASKTTAERAYQTLVALTREESARDSLVREVTLFDEHGSIKFARNT